MKRSEMLDALAWYLEEKYDLGYVASEEILNFLERQGMQPPPAVFMVDWDRWDPKKKEWYPTKEKISSNKWESEE